MKTATVPVQVGVNKYVWHAGRCWQVDHTILDHRGCMSLTSLRDSSMGVLAKPEDCHNCDTATMAAIEYFKNKPL
jgi:hypothetical protein